MELLTIQRISEDKPTHIITACEDSDTCPSCGAGYKVGLSACEYCRTPVRLSEGSFDREALRSHFMRQYSGVGFKPALLHCGEAVLPKVCA